MLAYLHSNYKFIVINLFTFDKNIVNQYIYISLKDFLPGIRKLNVNIYRYKFLLCITAAIYMCNFRHGIRKVKVNICGY